MKSLLDSIIIIIKLENIIKVSHIVIFKDAFKENFTNLNKFDESPNLQAFIYNARRFALHSRLIIKQAPL
jgi:hypothetical protein